MRALPGNERNQPPSGEEEIEPLSRLSIRVCQPADLAALEARISSGANQLHARRLDGQQQGEGVYLIGWAGSRPIAHLYLKWEAPLPLRARLPACPELNALSVWPPEARSQGVGGQMLQAGEQLARACGYAQVGLGVSGDNPRARQLYLRLGYHLAHPYLDRWERLGPQGELIQVEDQCCFMIKSFGKENA